MKWTLAACMPFHRFGQLKLFEILKTILICIEEQAAIKDALDMLSRTVSRSFFLCMLYCVTDIEQDGVVGITYDATGYGSNPVF